jgi:hypothetical protein
MIAGIVDSEIRGGSSPQPFSWSAARRRRSTSRSKRSHRYASFPTTPTSRLTLSSDVVFRSLSATSRRSAKLSWGERSGMLWNIWRLLVMVFHSAAERVAEWPPNGMHQVKNRDQFLLGRGFLLKRMWLSAFGIPDLRHASASRQLSQHWSFLCPF